MGTVTVLSPEGITTHMECKGCFTIFSFSDYIRMFSSYSLWLSATVKDSVTYEKLSIHSYSRAHENCATQTMDKKMHVFVKVYAPGGNKVKKRRYFYHRGCVILKGGISEECMPNMKFLPLMVQNL